MDESLPVAIIGAGPVGLAAAAHLVTRGLTPLLFERGTIGAALNDWAHVRLFSPWRYNVDAAARRLLEAHGWTMPDPEGLPTGGAMVQDYLAPLAALPELAPHIMTKASVTAISRAGRDKVTSPGRAHAPFTLRWTDRTGVAHTSHARAVIDASGTWTSPNPMGADGLTVPGETSLGDALVYGIPDVAGRAKADYADRTTLVVGSGHSALNTVLALLELRKTAPATRVIWAMRRNRLRRLLGGGLNDGLPARGALGLAARAALDAGELELLTGFSATALRRDGDDVRVIGINDGAPLTLSVDRIVVATGFRPELQMLRELRIDLDPATEAPPALSPLIDPNLHSCGTVPAHGVDELSHPEPVFYIAGSKSYGRAPTFLMATGYEQVRSIAAELAGDKAAARDLQLVLPETGVCGVPEAYAVAGGGGCCGGPSPQPEACCVADAEAKATGAEGCGCGTATPARETATQAEPA